MFLINASKQYLLFITCLVTLISPWRWDRQGWTLDDGTDRLSRKVGKELPLAAQ